MINKLISDSIYESSENIKVTTAVIDFLSYVKENYESEAGGDYHSKISKLLEEFVDEAN